MKKVLIVASVVSFIEWFNKENIAFLSKDLGCDVHIACNFQYMEDTDIERTKVYIQTLRTMGVTLHDIAFARSPFGKENMQAMRALKKIIGENSFDLIHCHTPVASVMTRIAAATARKQGTVVMYTCHGFHFHNASSWKNWLVYFPVEYIMSYFSDYIVTINKEDYNRAKTFHSKNVRYIPGVGVDLGKIQDAVVDRNAVRKSIGIPENAVLILAVGEMIERKNHEVIIRAIAQVDNPNIYFAIAGKGPLKQYLMQVAKEVNVAERVKFLGFRTDIHELHNVADIGAFPSKIEGLGLAGIEAMAAGVPLVSSNVHGILDYVIDGKTGYACNPEDVDGFAGAIERLANDAALRQRMKEDCLNAVEPFDLQNALDAMWDIYREILA